MNTETLIIDDDEISIMLTTHMIKNMPFAKEVNTFSDGIYAFKHLQETYSTDAQYIIILDINMPLMDGWEFLNKIKRLVSHNNTKVFMLSSSTDQQDIEKAKNTELVKGFFSKPIQKEHIEEIWKLVMHEK
jgi:CheY-like chemotaxis protein